MKKIFDMDCMFFFSVWMNSPIVFGAPAESAMPSRNIMIEKEKIYPLILSVFMTMLI